MYKYNTTENIMKLVILSLIPGVFVQTYYFGYATVIQIVISVIVGLCTECLFLCISRRPVLFFIGDYSAILSAILFSLCLPILVPWWINVIGSICMIILGKQLYGGLGQNIFNPAMTGYAIILVSFPTMMTNWNCLELCIKHCFNFFDVLDLIFSNKPFFNNLIVDLNNISVTQATPLNDFKLNQHLSLGTSDISLENIQSKYIFSVFFWINFWFLFGGIILLLYKIICWRISVSFLVSLFILSLLGSLYYPNLILSPKINLFSGATMLGSFFVLTDPVTSPSTNFGKIIFGCLIGFMVWIIRSFGNYPDSIAFSVLLGNSLVPLIDLLTKSRIYGYKKR
ncbi:Ion-translocating oxidoreductase complex subunit D [Buchnera aphidicola (Eriosoma lanigerum)]|uniref:RnfABCDGE type electron transport complex subunit D n=1 Tax=Buchnera aphidicola TaxID=9 RepID=UPI003463A648